MIIKARAKRGAEGVQSEMLKDLHNLVEVAYIIFMFIIIIIMNIIIIERERDHYYYYYYHHYVLSLSLSRTSSAIIAKRTGAS